MRKKMYNLYIVKSLISVIIPLLFLVNTFNYFKIIDFKTNFLRLNIELFNNGFILCYL